MRKEKLINLTDDDKELTFKVKQMSALKQERWINRVLILLTGSKTLGSIFGSINVSNIQNSIKDFNLDTLLEVFGKMDYEKVEPLYNELLECCYHVPNPNNPSFCTQLTANNADSIIGEVKNLYLLRLEALKINFSFFAKGAKSPNHKKADIVIGKHM